MKDETHAAILKKFSDACKVLGHVLVVALQCAAADFNELGVAPQALNLSENLRNTLQYQYPL